MPALGRPFLVDATPRVAAVVERGGWAEGSAPSLARLSPEARTKLRDAWARIGQMEHASVAAFARFALELVALGAPADLLRWTQRAMADEIDHAERAFALASTYGGRGVGPGPLDVNGALENPTPRSVLRTLVREGCIGETLAAVEAAAALEGATDEAVRATLETVVRDETSHAALAWTAARWLLEREGEELRAWLSMEFEVAIAERAALPSAGTANEDPSLAAHGILGGRSLERFDHAALADLVAPNLALLLGGRLV